jgi:hypothetical protein
MVLLPFAFDPLGRFGPILRHFLLNSTPHQHLDFHPSRPNATKMYKRIMTFPCPKGILPLADHQWTHSRTREFFGHSYSSPTLVSHHFSFGTTIVVPVHQFLDLRTLRIPT